METETRPLIQATSDRREFRMIYFIVTATCAAIFIAAHRLSPGR